MSYIFWDTAYILRLISLSLSTATGMFILSTLSKKKLPAIIAASPSFIVWGIAFYLALMRSGPSGHLLHTLAGILTLTFSTILGRKIGLKYHRKFYVTDSFFRPLNIPWYHWLWILPIVVYQVAAVPLFLIIHSLSFDYLYGNEQLFYPIDFQPTKLGILYYLFRILSIFLTLGVAQMMLHMYDLITDNNQGKFKRIFLIITYLILLLISDSIIFSNS
jgi:hypothetical protein